MKMGSSGNGKAVPSASAIMGISAEGLYRLLQDLRVARMQLSEAMDDLEASSGAVEASSSTMVPELEPARNGQEDGRGYAKAGQAPSSGPWQPSQDLIQSSVRWRNRFLRSLKAAAEGRSGFASAAHPISVVSRASERVRNATQSSAPHHDLGSGQLVGQRTRPPHSPHGMGVSGSTEASCSSPYCNLQNPAVSIRPLGLWLPDRSWGSCHDSGMNSRGNCLPPWSVALPAFLTAPSDSPLGGRDVARPMSFSCPDAQHAIAHGRAVQQLQQCLMQLYLEGTLAAALVPTGRPPPASLCVAPHRGTREFDQPGIGGRLGHGQVKNPHVGWEERQAELRLDRHLVRLRLAHVFLTKGAWNKRCSVVEVIEE